MDLLKLEDELKYYDILFNEKKLLENLFIKNGFRYYEPAVIEDLEYFTEINNNVNTKDLVKLIKGDGSVSVLRYDATTSIIHKITSRLKNDKLKIFYFGKTYKNEKLKFRATNKFGCEVIGVKTIDEEVEVIKLAIDLLKQYTDIPLLEIGHSLFMKEVIDALKLNSIESKKVLKAISNMDLVTIDLIVKDSIYKDILKVITSTQGDFESVKKQLYKLDIPDKLINILKEANIIYKKFPKEYISFNLALNSLYDYYKGIVFNGYIPSINKTVLKGGKYFVDESSDLYSIGFSTDFDSLVKLKFEGDK